MTEDAWNYFRKDSQYSDVLKDRLARGVEMDSAKAMASYMTKHFSGPLNVQDFGSGPGHYYPILQRGYAGGLISYRGVDIDQSNIDFGNEYFQDDPVAALELGSVLTPQIRPDTNAVISANTLPHVPSIAPLLQQLRAATQVRYFVFRMLIGSECVQIRKHLLENEYSNMFEQDFQFNNIYTLNYMSHLLGPDWAIEIEPDVVDSARLTEHRIPAQDTDQFYGNRVSRSVAGMVFKGEVYMPWKFVVGIRRVPAV